MLLWRVRGSSIYSLYSIYTSDSTREVRSPRYGRAPSTPCRRDKLFYDFVDLGVRREK